MTCLGLSLSAACIMAFSGVPALFGRRGAPLGQRLAAILMVLGGVLGLIAIAPGAAGAQPLRWAAAWPLPLGRCEVALDGLSAIFLAPVFLVPALGAIYGLNYWPPQAFRAGQTYNLEAELPLQFGGEDFLRLHRRFGRDDRSPADR